MASEPVENREIIGKSPTEADSENREKTEKVDRKGPAHGLKTATATAQGIPPHSGQEDQRSASEGSIDTEHATGGSNVANGKNDRAMRTETFWNSKPTEAAMKCLDIWASVMRARASNGNASIPKADAIFEKEIPNLPEWVDQRSGLRIDDWPVYRKDQTDKLQSPEEAVYLGVSKIIKQARLVRYGPIILTYFPRMGVYRDRKMLEFIPDEIAKADQLAIADVVRAIKAANREPRADHEQRHSRKH